MSTTLLEIDPAACTVLRNADGTPVVVDATATGWSVQFARNTTYAIHPEEVLADNFSLAVRRRLGTPNAPSNRVFLDAFEATLAEHALG